jgi:beta-N-acetylhexosaminidase
MRSRRSLLLPACLVSVGLAGSSLCTGPLSAVGHPNTVAVPYASAASAVSAALAASAASLAQGAYDRLTAAQRIGQLFMVGGDVNGLGSSTTTAIRTYHVGNLILTGRTTTGTPPVRYRTGRAGTLATTAATGGVPLFIAADQEGGFVQVLQGPGFSRMPTALTQGGWAGTTLTAYAKVWGRQMMRSGVDLDLAPVMDTVAKSFASSNKPIGYFQREFGYTPTVVAAKGTAFLKGMQASGLAMTAKHFPGLGRVTGNTDTTAGVTDTVTTRTSADIGPFRAAVAAGAHVLMVSSAYYARIDRAHPAVFSPTVIRGMIRGDLGFRGIVVSDDIGRARQVAAWSPGARAVAFLGAGGDMVLTVDPSVVPAMVRAVTARSASDSVFRAAVRAAVLRVLTVKAQYGLLAPRLPVTGTFGPLTKRALQRWLGIPQTGIFDAATIRALQARVGAPVVGVWGPRSTAALQSYLGLYRDGAPTWNVRTVAGLQRYLNTQL